MGVLVFPGCHSLRWFITAQTSGETGAVLVAYDSERALRVFYTSTHDPSFLEIALYRR